MYFGECLFGLPFSDILCKVVQWMVIFEPPPQPQMLYASEPEPFI